MPILDLNLVLLSRTLENGAIMAEPILFPEVTCLGTDTARLRGEIARRVRELVKRSPHAELFRRRIAGSPRAARVAVKIEPPARGPAWREPVSIEFECVTWRHGDDAQIALVPALGIEVVARTRTELAARIAKHIQAALARRPNPISLRDLQWLDRSTGLKLKRIVLPVNVLSPKQTALRERGEAARDKSVLKEIATDLTKEPLAESYEIGELARRLAEVLTSRLAKSVLLVGASGVGKTALVYELVRRRAELQFAHTPFWTTGGSRLIAGASGFGMWQERCQRLVREAGRTRAIVHVGQLVELIEVGKCLGNAQGIAAFLRPFLARGELLAIAECTPEQLPIIEREDPVLLDAFHQLRVPEPDTEQGRSILLSFAAAFRQLGPEGKGGAVPIDIDAILEIDRLHRRYATYSAYPGRPLRFLRHLLEDHRGNEPISASLVSGTFSRQTGLPPFMLDATLPMRPPDTSPTRERGTWDTNPKRERGMNLEAIPGEPFPSLTHRVGGRDDVNLVRDWFARRVIGQAGAVDLVVNMLAAVKAGLTRPRRPIASLLFIGPTGVGKTEMAKALCEFLIRDPSRMVRFDMSEYADALAVERLITGTRSTHGLLTARVREQPFTVVLLDELEKAHAAFFDLLLQVLGEGRLTDAAGRVADFSNAVVIMTSNLGAESFGRGQVGFVAADVPDGSHAASSHAEDHFVRRVRDFFRPEFYNRIDHVVPFPPLDPTTILEIARRELAAISDRDGVRFRGVTLAVDDAVTRELARRGYHVRYGARPLKRAIERTLVAPLAEHLNRLPSDAALAARVELDSDRLRWHIEHVGTGPARPPSDAANDPGLKLAGDVTTLRRQVQALRRSSAVLALENEITRIEQMERQFKRRIKAGWFRPFPQQAKLEHARQQLARVDTLVAEVSRLEDESLLGLYRREPPDLSRLTDECAVRQSELQTIVMDAYLRTVSEAKLVTLVIFGDKPQHVRSLARAYDELARQERFTVQRYHLTFTVPTRRRDPRAAGTHLFVERDGLFPVQVALLPVSPGGDGAAVARSFGERRGRWLDALADDRARVEDDPFPLGPVIRIYAESGHTLDLRSSLSVDQFPAPHQLRTFVLANLSPVPEFLER